MRREGDFGVIPERVRFGQGLGAKHIQCGAGQMPAVQCGQQIGLHQMGTARHVDDIAAMVQLAQPLCIQNILGLRRQRQQTHHHAARGQKSIELRAACKALHTGHVFGRAAPAIHRKVKLRHRPGYALAQHPQPQHADRKINPTVRFAERPFAMAHVGLVAFKFPKMPDDVMAHVLRHLHRHAGIVQPDDLRLRSDPQLEQSIYPGPDVEQCLERRLLIQELLGRRPHHSVISLRTAWLPDKNVYLGNSGMLQGWLQAFQPGRGCRIGAAKRNAHGAILWSKDSGYHFHRHIQTQQLRTIHHLVAGRKQQLGHGAIGRGGNGVLHLHGFHHRQGLAFFDDVTRLDGERHHLARHGCRQAATLCLHFTGVGEWVNCYDLRSALRSEYVGYIAILVHMAGAAHVLNLSSLAGEEFEISSQFFEEPMGIKLTVQLVLGFSMHLRFVAFGAVALCLVLSGCGGGGGGSNTNSTGQNNNQPVTGGGSSGAAAYSASFATPLVVLNDGRLVLKAIVNGSGEFGQGPQPGLLVWDPVSKSVQSGYKLTLSSADLNSLVGPNATYNTTSYNITGVAKSADGGMILSVDIFGPNQDPLTSTGKAHVYVKLTSGMALQWVTAFAPFEDYGTIEARSTSFVSSNGITLDANGAVTSALTMPALPYFSLLLGSGKSLLANGGVIGNSDNTYATSTGSFCTGNAGVKTADGGALVAGAGGANVPVICKTDSTGASLKSVTMDYSAPGGGFGGFSNIVELGGSYYAASTNNVNYGTSSAEWVVCKFSADLTLDKCVVSTDRSGNFSSPIGLVADASAGHLYVSVAGSGFPFATLNASLASVGGTGHPVTALVTTPTVAAITPTAPTPTTLSDGAATLTAKKKVVTITITPVTPANLTLPANLSAALQ